ncbi:2-C-methyl-D-erythritol 2,4-cyclodiphosphate synthase [Thiohalorhabdus sp.]|uniref:2-C-methyl-D-erythritol 2,4-cyclodiphosphate synthase n=1 Tax=Thiohalorhabdus sp. TaxID=3094134 RepID=UPI002FC378A7
MRIGQGFDAHTFAQDRPLILGGVRILADYGLAGHSDADVVLHALCDALLGASGHGDLGRRFPDTDPAHADRDSREFVRETSAMVAGDGWSVANADLTVVAQKPKLAPFIPDMEAVIAAELGIGEERVNVKATTSERMGWTGRGEGIAALAMVLLKPAAQAP